MAGDLDQRALAAAVAVAAVYGLAQEQATVIYSGSNVVVHLCPAPVVARVMTGTMALHHDPRRWLEREISVLEFLAPSGLAVAPSPLMASGLHHHDGLWMTFSEWIADVGPATHLDDAHRLGRTLRDLHDALQPFDGDLGDLRALRGDIERLHGQLRPADARQAGVISVLQARLTELREVVFEATLPTQALHGDVSLTNLLGTPHRLVWDDLRTPSGGRFPGISLATSSVFEPTERARASSEKCSTPTAGTIRGAGAFHRRSRRLRRDLADVRPAAASFPETAESGKPSNDLKTDHDKPVRLNVIAPESEDPGRARSKLILLCRQGSNEPETAGSRRRRPVQTRRARRRGSTTERF